MVVVGGGPVGLTIALDLGQKGHQVILLNRLDFVAAGSKAICFAKRTLEIWDRLGVGDAMVDKGVIWNVGKIFWGDREEPIYQFDLLPQKMQKMPAFINLQQYHAEDRLVWALAELPNVQIRWGHEVIGIAPDDEGARLTVRTEQGSYELDADYVIACDGAKSTIRDQLGLEFEGRVFEDNFLIADVRVKGERPSERWFWFDPPFNPGRSALLHKQPENVWRLDFQLGWDIDREAAVRPENVEPLVRGMLGEDVAFEREWYSVYTFQCRRMPEFVHGRVIFAGDSAHLVSPFGARGCNGGIADSENLAWKLDLILSGKAPERLLESYSYEAAVTADENIRHSSRSTDFMTPKCNASRILRDSVLALAADHPFARLFVNSGRLSTAVSYPHSALNTPDIDDWRGAGVPPGSLAIDVPMSDTWLLGSFGHGFSLLTCGRVPLGPDVPKIIEADGAEPIFRERYALEDGTAYLIRPDHYVAARWRAPRPELVQAALSRAMGIPQ